MYNWDLRHERVNDLDHMENASVPSLNFEKPALKISFRAVAHKHYSERKLTYVYIFVKGTLMQI